MSEPDAQEGDRQHELVLAAARRRGVAITDVSEYLHCRAALLELGDRRELLVKGILSRSMNLQTKFTCDFKQLTKVLFKRLEIPSPSSSLFVTPSDPRLSDFVRAGGRYVCKPQVAANGIGVEMNITSVEQVHDYWTRHRDLDEAFLIEEQIDGTDLRIQVIDRRIAACCIRVPAHVIGDGSSTLMQLIERRRVVMRGQNPSNRLDLDRITLGLIDEHGLELDSVPEPGRNVQLKRVSNIGVGGHAIDVTDEVHPMYHDWVNRIVAWSDADYFALDVICDDYREDPATNAVALELNSLAEWIHHTFSEIRTHDLGEHVIEAAFGQR